MNAEPVPPAHQPAQADPVGLGGWPERLAVVTVSGFQRDAIAEFQQTLARIGVWTTLVVGVHAFSTPFSRRDLVGLEVPLWLSLLVLFAALQLLPLFPDARWRSRPALLGRAALGTGLALGANELINGSSILAGLLLVVAAQVGVLLAGWRAAAWIGGQFLGLLLILLRNWNAADAWAYSTGYLCFQVFALVAARTAVREIEGRQKLSAVVDELRATRALLGDAARQAERLVISRELHDVLGHHLTALCMNLEVARHHAASQEAAGHGATSQDAACQRALPAIERTSELARALLDDVRQTVHRIRDDSTVDFQQELDALLRPCTLNVNLTFDPPDFNVTCPVHALALLRTVQEILTNAQRHAHARTVTLAFRVQGQTLHLSAFDDGQSPEKLRLGCGLSGMRERLESLGGSLALFRHAGGGLGLQATLPRWSTP